MFWILTCICASAASKPIRMSMTSNPYSPPLFRNTPWINAHNVCGKSGGNFNFYTLLIKRYTGYNVVVNGDLSYLLIHWQRHNLDRSRPFASEVLVSNSHIFLYHTNSALMFYFILFYFSIKCEKNEKEFCTNI